MATSSRRPHQKSRNSCQSCKRRRVKCNSTFPQCANCHRRGDVCTYATTIIPSWAKGPRSPSPQVQFSQPQSVVPLSFSLSQNCAPDALSDTSGHSDWTKRMLRHHFFTQTTYTLTVDPNSKKANPWRIHLPILSPDYPFLHDCLLTLASLHLCHLGVPDAKVYYQAACLHSMKASESFTSSITTIDTSNLLPVLAFFLTHTLFHLNIDSIGEDLRILPLGSSNCLEGLNILRRANVMFSIMDNLFKHTYLPLFVTPNPSLETHYQLAKDSRSRLSTLCESASVSIAQDSQQRNINVKAAQILTQWVDTTNGAPMGWKQLLEWPTFVSDDFFALLSDKEPTAVRIFQEWCTIMRNAPPRWFLDRWLERLTLTLA